MTWFKVDDGFALHPKAIAAGNAALGLWVRAGSWCGAHLTDGRLPAGMVGTLGGHARDARKLIAAGLWCQTEDGYQFVDWEQWQPTKAQVKAERDATRERVKRWREGQRNAVTEPVTNGVSNGATNAAPSRPVPSRSGLGSQSPNGHHPSGHTDDETIHKIAAELGQPPDWARRVIRDVLSRTDRRPANIGAYVLAAVRAEPHRYQPVTGPPPLDRLCEHGRDRLTCRECAR